MNALLLSSVLGVVMMFGGLLLKRKSAVRNMATAGLFLLFAVNILEMAGIVFFKINVEGMMHFDRFSLLFNSIMLFSTFIYFLLSARDIERAGNYYSEYFALLFFILCGSSLFRPLARCLFSFLGLR